MVITVTYRRLGVDVPASAPNIDYIQFDSDVAAFDANTTYIDVWWNGANIHFSPANIGPSPTVTFFSTIRVSVSNAAAGPINTTLIAVHASPNDIYINAANPNVGDVSTHVPLVRPPTSTGVLDLPNFDLTRIAAGDPVALRDAFTAISRTMQEIGFALSTALLGVKWVPQPYAQATFTVESPDGGVWTVDAADQVQFDYVRLGDILFMQIFLQLTSTLAAKTYTSLYITIPGGYRTQGAVLHSGLCVITPNAAEEIGLVEADGTGAGQPVDKLRIRRLPLGTAFPAGLTNTLSLRVVIQFRIVPPPDAQ